MGEKECGSTNPCLCSNKTSSRSGAWSTHAHSLEQQRDSGRTKGGSRALNCFTQPTSWTTIYSWLSQNHKFQLSSQNVFNHPRGSLKEIQKNDKVINKHCIKKKRANKISCFSKEKWSLEEKGSNSKKIKYVLGKKSVKLISILAVIVHSRNHTIWHVMKSASHFRN